MSGSSKTCLHPPHSCPTSALPWAPPGKKKKSVLCITNTLGGHSPPFLAISLVPCTSHHHEQTGGKTSPHLKGVLGWPRVGVCVWGDSGAAPSAPFAQGAAHAAWDRGQRLSFNLGRAKWPCLAHVGMELAAPGTDLPLKEGGGKEEGESGSTQIHLWSPAICIQSSAVGTHGVMAPCTATAGDCGDFVLPTSWILGFSGLGVQVQGGEHSHQGTHKRTTELCVMAQLGLLGLMPKDLARNRVTLSAGELSLTSRSGEGCCPWQGTRNRCCQLCASWHDPDQFLS